MAALAKKLWLSYVAPLFNRPDNYRFDFDTAKKRCRILLLDDDPNALPLEDLKRDKYNIEQYIKIDADLLRQCENGTFDIILLDYNGIAPQNVSETDGFGIFDRIRSANVRQYIIAISGQTYDISRTEYFRKANSWLKKPSDLLTTKQKLDDGIRRLFDRDALLTDLSALLAEKGVNKRDIDRVLDALKASTVKTEADGEDVIHGITRLATISRDVIKVIHQLIQIKALM